MNYNFSCNIRSTSSAIGDTASKLQQKQKELLCYIGLGGVYYPSYLNSSVCGALFESVIGITPYLSFFEVEGKLKALLRHHLVACLAIPLVAVGPLLLGLSIAVDKADGDDIVAWDQ